jgi:Tfp pilus assembly protein PilN
MAIALERLRGGGVDVPINLLPAEVQAEQRMRRVFGGAAFGAATLILILILLSVLQNRTISNTKRDLATERATAARLQTQVGSLQAFGQMEARILATRQALGAALVGDVAWTRFMSDLSQTIPADSWVQSLSLSATPGTSPAGVPHFGAAQYSGFVTSFPGLSGWLSSMAKLRGLHFVYLGSGSKGEGGVVSFSASANLTQSILSGRCQTETAPCP